LWYANRKERIWKTHVLQIGVPLPLRSNSLKQCILKVKFCKGNFLYVELNTTLWRPYRGVEVYLYAFLTSALDEGLISFTFRQLYPQGKNPDTYWIWEARWAPHPVWTRWRRGEKKTSFLSLESNQGHRTRNL